MAALLQADSLPGFWRAADEASKVGQRRTLLLARGRIIGLVLAASTSLFLTPFPDVRAVPVIAAVGFAVVLASEVIAWVIQPERDWYSGRALAESTKTLAWRFAVAGAPFSRDMSEISAAELLASRVDEISQEARDRVVVKSRGAVTTPGMQKLRRLSFLERKQAYLVGRIDDQHEWYFGKAISCRKKATSWRVALITGQIAAITLAVAQLAVKLPLNFAGLGSTLIGCAGAWVAVKQYSSLASAYSVTATELALVRLKVEGSDEESWAQIVDDSEEAISREHTLWLASRVGKSPANPTR